MSSLSPRQPVHKFYKQWDAWRLDAILRNIRKPPRSTTGDYRQFKDVKFYGDEVTYVSLGDGTTSEGEFWEALNTASNKRLPIIFVVEDNEYAISVPVEVQTAGGNISRLVSGL